MKKLKKKNIIKINFLFLLIVFSCDDDPVSNHEQPDTLPITQIEFTNLEQYPVTIYSDSLRQSKIAEINANENKIIEYDPYPYGITFYTTFNIDLFDNQDIIIPFNSEPIVTVIKPDIINPIKIQKIESFGVNISYLVINNISDFSVALQQAGTEINPLGGGSSVIMPNVKAVYEVLPDQFEWYTVMKNTNIPVELPSNLIEFKQGFIYVLNFNGNDLVLSEINSVLQKVPPATPENIQITGGRSSSAEITWNEVFGATLYRVYRATGSETGTYSLLTTTSDLSYINTGLLPGQTYFYKVSALGNVDNEGNKSNAVSIFVVLPPNNIQITNKNRTSITIGWNSITSAIGYNIYRSDNQTGTYEKITQNIITGNSFIDNNVTSFTTYYYKVNAIFQNDVSELSNGIIADTGVVVQGDSLGAKFSWLQSNAVSNSEYAIYLDKDESIEPINFNFTGISDIKIILIGNETMRTINLASQGVMFNLSYGVTLILENNITLKGLTNNNTCLVSIPWQAELIMNDNTKIIDNNGGGVVLYESGVFIQQPYYRGGKFTMNGGEISGNTRSYGAGVYLGGQGDATFIMNGGKICNNTGGGVDIYGYSVDNTFIMNGGEIFGNTGSNGAGVCLDRRSNFIMNAGKIYNNIAPYRGGGVLIYSGTFSMKNGEIYNNSSPTGGGVAINNTGVFRMSGGVIFGNNAPSGYGNFSTNGSALYRESGNASYGVFNGNNYYSYGSLNTTDNTVRIINGVLQNN